MDENERRALTDLGPVQETALGAQEAHSSSDPCKMATVNLGARSCAPARLWTLATRR
jgi:hypothetical protein